MIGPLLQQVLQHAHTLGHLLHSLNELYESWERSREQEREAESSSRYVEEREIEQQRQTVVKRDRQDEDRYQHEAAVLQRQVDDAHRQFVRSVEHAAAASGQSVDGFLAKLRSIPTVTPSTTVPCPRCRSQLKHLGNEGLHTCPACNTRLYAWQCVYCFRWRSSSESHRIASILEPCPHCNNQARSSRYPAVTPQRVPDEAELRELVANLRNWLTPNPWTD